MRRVTLLFTLALMPVLAVSATWKYAVKKDPMSDEVQSFATVLSTNSVQLKFPYNGGTKAWLTIQQRGQKPASIVLEVNRGQFLCSSGGCTVNLKFDGAEVVDYRGESVGDGSTNAIFILSEPTFLETAPAAKRLRVQTMMFQEGMQVFEFDVAGLVWPPPSPKTKTH